MLRSLCFIKNFVGVEFEGIPFLQGELVGQLGLDHPEHGFSFDVLHLQVHIAAIGAHIPAGADPEKDPDSDQVANPELLIIDYLTLIGSYRISDVVMGI